MNHSRPLGTLDGGGWNPAPVPGAAGVSTGFPNKSRKDKVLTEMFEMFLDSVEPDIIESVVKSYNFNRNKAMETLLSMSGSGKDSVKPVSSQPNTSHGRANIPSGQASIPHGQAHSVHRQGNTSYGQRQAMPKENPKSLFHIQPSNATGYGRENGRSVTDDAGKASNLEPRPLPIYFPPQYAQPKTCPITGNIIPPPIGSYVTKRKLSDSIEGKMEKIRWYVEHGNKIMVLMRGCPGSGKTFLAKGLIKSFGGAPQDYVFSTDDFFWRRNDYCFQPSQLHEAHEWNQKRVLAKMRDGRSPIFIDNTNTQLWEMTIYANLAISNGYAIEVLEPQTAWFNKIDELVKRNKHGVPRDKIRLMLERYEYGLTAEALMKSTGAKYTKLPPQQAAQPLRVYIQQEPNDTSNRRLPQRGREQDLDGNNVHQKFLSDKFIIPGAPKKSYTNADKIPEQMSSMQPILEITKSPDSDGFYFGPTKRNDSHAGNYNGSISSCKTGVEGPQSIEDRTSKLLTGSFKTRFVPVKSRDDNTTEENGREESTSQNSFSSNVLDNKFPISTSAFKTSENSGILPSENQKILNDFMHTKQEPNLSKSSNAASVNSSKNFEENVTFKWIQNLKFSNPIQISKDVSSTNTSPNYSPSDIKNIMDCTFTPELSASDQINKCVREEAINRNSPKVQEIFTGDFTSMGCSASGITQELETLKLPDSWISNGDQVDNNNKVLHGDLKKEITLTKQQRSFNPKNMEEYCKGVKDINNKLQNGASGRPLSESNLISWQVLEKNQQEFYCKEKSTSPQGILTYSQQSNLKDCQVSEKETNTHHADFIILNNLSSNNDTEGINVLNAQDRDINEATPVTQSPQNRNRVKLMLDKGTLTVDDYCEDLHTDSKQNKVRELSRLFPNRSPASIKELLKQCKWDVNYVSNLLLDDTDNNTSNDNDTSFIADGSNDSDSDLESSNKQSVKEQTSVSQNSDAANGTSECDSNTSPTHFEAEKVKRHIEQTIDFSEESYSPHLLSIKNFRRGLREGAIPKSGSPVYEGSTVFPTEPPDVVTCVEPLQESSQAKVENNCDEDGYNEYLEFVVHQDFIQQLVDKFGSPPNIGNVSSVVKFPPGLARQIYDIIFYPNDEVEEEDDEELAIKLQCEEDERIARELYEQMLNLGMESEKTSPQLREIMDMELAQAIYKADVDSLTSNSQETMANVLAKRLLEQNYKHVDTKVLHEIYASCNNSFEDTVKTLQEALSNDEQIFSDSGRARREEELIAKAKQASVQRKTQSSFDTYHDNVLPKLKSAEDSLDDINPWESSDPMAIHNEYRKKADEFSKERALMYEKARDAFRRQQRSVAAYYSQLGNLNNKKFHDANAVAAAALAAVHTSNHSVDTLDLHHFKVVEALIIYDMFLDYHIRLLSDPGTGHECLKIITGRGTHSVNGKAKIKPAVIQRSKKRGLRYEISPNPGLIKVWISRNSDLSYEVPE